MNPSSLQADKPFPINSFPIMISGCLLGLHCRYDGEECGFLGVIDFASSANIIPFCPEQLGGLHTPRPPINIVGGAGQDVIPGKARVIDNTGQDVTDAFIKGAEEALILARLTGVKIVLLKDKSPSCGIWTPHCDKGTDSGMGITAALLHFSGINIVGVNPEDSFPPTYFLALLKEINGIP
ncbi:MAG: DUF523 domain-containing protein [Thermodesulfobacteriota bacterium]|nr:DUF523 domain-containing protein [Thermodesulfobacteriota bacterium]